MGFSILKGSYKFMKGKPGALIPSETPTGQLSMLPATFGRPAPAARGVIGRGLGGRVTNPPPFKSQGYGIGDPRAKAMGKARSEELSMKAKVAAKRAKKKPYGPMTEVDYVDSLFFGNK
jgi:hypothetical protein